MHFLVRKGNFFKKFILYKNVQWPKIQFFSMSKIIFCCLKKKLVFFTILNLTMLHYFEKSIFWGKWRFPWFLNWLKIKIFLEDNKIAVLDKKVLKHLAHMCNVCTCESFLLSNIFIHFHNLGRSQISAGAGTMLVFQNRTPTVHCI